MATSDPRLIDANKLDYAQRYAAADPDSDKLVPVLAVDKCQIETAPTIDAVQVTRCKDCEEWVDGACRHFSSYELPGLLKAIVFRTQPESYCSNAQRREEHADHAEE